jgi:hypothetical protein
LCLAAKKIRVKRQADADVLWHQPVATHLSTASDLVRGRRLIEEPALSCLLFKVTEPARRVPLTRAALQHILAVTEDDEEREWATQCLEALKPPPLARDRGFDSTAASYDRWKTELRGAQASSSWERIGRGKRG